MGAQAPGLPGIGRQGQLGEESGSLAPGLLLLLVHSRLSLLICSSTLSRQTDEAGVMCMTASCQFTLHLSTHSLAVSEKWQCPLISIARCGTQMYLAPGSYLSHGAARVRFLSLHAPSGPTLARALHPLDKSQGLSSLVLVSPINSFIFLMFVLSPLLLPEHLLIPVVSDLQSLLFVQSAQARERKGVS